ELMRVFGSAEKRGKRADTGGRDHAVIAWSHALSFRTCPKCPSECTANLFNLLGLLDILSGRMSKTSTPRIEQMDTTKNRTLANPNIAVIEKTGWCHAHGATVYCQAIFPSIAPDSWKPGALAYNPCWAKLDPGMELEVHHHATPE